MEHTKPENRNVSQDELRHEKNREAHPGKKAPKPNKTHSSGKK
ncbi:hypothetical protein [Legionella geestiana]|nr:hypothetical protein [Legionella geestiana]STX53590.1 Uncharacterised protein [Legionella geestiana]